MNELIEIANDGQNIKNTNYWDTPHAAKGMYFLSWNAGAARLLVPDVQAGILDEVQNVACVIISRGKWIEHNNIDAVELLFEDNSDFPYVITLPVEQCDRVIQNSDKGRKFTFSMWTRSGLMKSFSAVYREVDILPCLQPI